MVSPPSTHDDFGATRWSLIRDLRADQAGPHNRSQLNELCLRYWVPIQQHFARLGYGDDEARRLTGRFFAHLQGEALLRAEQYGRFRAFLQAELQTFLARAVAATGATATDAEEDEMLQHSFAVQVIAHCMVRLRGEAIEADRLAMFEALKRYLSREAYPADVQREALALGAKPLFVTMAIRRLRQRFRHLVDDELSHLVTDATELAAERDAMFAAMARGP